MKKSNALKKGKNLRHKNCAEKHTKKLKNLPKSLKNHTKRFEIQLTGGPYTIGLSKRWWWWGGTILLLLLFFSPSSNLQMTSAQMSWKESPRGLYSQWWCKQGMLSRWVCGACVCYACTKFHKSNNFFFMKKSK